jgi:hypothetical protein
MGVVDGEVACVFGLIPPTLLSDRAYIWLLSTDLVEQHKFLFVRYSQLWMGEMLKTYDAIYGHCMVGNEKAIKWLKWLGADFFGVDGGRLKFVIRRKHG